MCVIRASTSSMSRRSTSARSTGGAIAGSAGNQTSKPASVSARTMSDENVVTRYAGQGAARTRACRTSKIGSLLRESARGSTSKRRTTRVPRSRKRQRDQRQREEEPGSWGGTVSHVGRHAYTFPQVAWSSSTRAATTTALSIFARLHRLPQIEKPELRTVHSLHARQIGSVAPALARACGTHLLPCSLCTGGTPPSARKIQDDEPAGPPPRLRHPKLADVDKLVSDQVTRRSHQALFESEADWCLACKSGDDELTRLAPLVRRTEAAHRARRVRDRGARAQGVRRGRSSSCPSSADRASTMRTRSPPPCEATAGRSASARRSTARASSISSSGRKRRSSTRPRSAPTRRSGSAAHADRMVRRRLLTPYLVAEHLPRRSTRDAARHDQLSHRRPPRLDTPRCGAP